MVSATKIAKEVLSQAWGCIEFWTPLGFTVFILWLLYRPDRFHPIVDSGVLTTLNATVVPTNATDRPPSLQFDMTVDLSFHNSHRRLSIHYLDVSATAFYNGSTKLGPAIDELLPTRFRQGPKNTTVVHPAFRGTVDVDSVVVAKLKRELAAGTVHMRVRVSLTLMYKVWPLSEIFFRNYDCWLWFPRPRRSAPAIFDAGGTHCWAAKPT